MKQFLLVVIVTFGIVDQIHDNYALVEYTDKQGELQYIDFPLNVFPCKVKEGSSVTFSKSGQQTNIVCKD